MSAPIDHGGRTAERRCGGRSGVVQSTAVPIASAIVHSPHRFAAAPLPLRRRVRSARSIALVVALSAAPVAALGGVAFAGDLRAKLAGSEALRPSAYASAATEKHAFTVREFDPLVPQKFADIAADPERDVTLAVYGSGGNAGFMPAFVIRIAGARATPATAVVPPGVPIAFRNDDPFTHHLVGEGWSRDLPPGATHQIEPKGKGASLVTDTLTPSVKAWIVVEAGVVADRFANHDGAVKADVPSGEVTIKAFFEGKEKTSVGLKIAAAGSTEVKEPFVVGPVPSASTK